jgi:hypothetical protein
VHVHVLTADTPRTWLLRIRFTKQSDGQLIGSHASSGGFSDYIFRYAAEHLFSRNIVGDLQYQKVRRNADYQELSLEVDGRVVLNFARAYGFRNIQNIVRAIKQNKCKYHYIEIMACPSGMYSCYLMMMMMYHLPVWFGLVWFGLVWFGLVWFGLVWFGLATNLPIDSLSMLS